MYLFLWLAVMIACLIVEGMTYALYTIWFALGALGAALVAYLGKPFLWQIVVFGAVSLFFLLVTRPLAVKYMKKGLPKTNVNSLVGRNAIVLEEINEFAQTGKVKLYDVEWLARAEEGSSVIPVGEIVTIVAVEGVRLTVEDTGRRVSTEA